MTQTTDSTNRVTRIRSSTADRVKSTLAPSFSRFRSWKASSSLASFTKALMTASKAGWVARSHRDTFRVPVRPAGSPPSGAVEVSAGAVEFSGAGVAVGSGVPAEQPASRLRHMAAARARDSIFFMGSTPVS